MQIKRSIRIASLLGAMSWMAGCLTLQASPPIGSSDSPKPSPTIVASATASPRALPISSSVATPTVMAPAEDFFEGLKVKTIEPLFPDGIEGVVPGLFFYAQDIAVDDQSPPTIYFLEETNTLVGLKNTPPPILGNILGIKYGNHRGKLNYYNGDVYFNGDGCIVKGSTNPNQYPKKVSIINGECLSNIERAPEMTVASNGDIYLIISSEKGMKFKRIHNNEEEILFESAPLGGITKKLIGHGPGGFKLECPVGVCQPGLYRETETPPFISYLWEYYDINGLPKRHFIEVFGDNIPSQSIPILKDGPRGEATFWAPEGLQVDKQGNIYFLEHFIEETYLRRISPEGQLTTLVSRQRDNLLDPKNRKNAISGLLPAQHVLVDVPGVPLSPECPSSFPCYKQEPDFRVFTIDQQHQILYLLGAYLFALDLKSEKFKLIASTQNSSGPQLPNIGASDLDADVNGDLYATLGISSLRSNTLKDLTSKVFQIRLH
jgi:hypothetical protein